MHPAHATEDSATGSRVLGLPGAHDLLALAAAYPGRYPCLLESVAHGPAHARWDLLPAFPQSRLELGADGVTRVDGQAATGSFLDRLDHAWHSLRTARGEDALPFHGGWALLLAYELVAQIEPGLQLPPAPGPMPVALALRCPAAVLVDHASQRTLLVAEAGHADKIACMQDDLARAQVPGPPAVIATQVREDPPAPFLDGVARVQEHLSAGDVFQVNLSRAWHARPDVAVTPAKVHAALRKANPAPFAGLWQDSAWAVSSSSPERLVEVRGGRVQTRPIAGTRPRMAGENDAERIGELVGHPKERAEHIMLIDLERNDLGRVCLPGSVEVDELMSVESYAHVHHIVSNVRGTLRPDVSPGQVIAATFPGGTITGCPKVRCMQIIAALEGVGRGAYTGAMGYLDRNGDMDLNILIRTLSMHDGGIELRAGAGIVVDSRAQAELEETRHKARGLLKALGVQP